MMTVDMPTVTTSLEDLLAAWCPSDHAETAGICLVCAGETHRIELRGGAGAWACRECGSLLEDADAIR